LYLKKVMTSTGTKPTKSQGATCLGSGNIPSSLPQAGHAKTEAFTVFNNYVALPASEALRIQYWALGEAKLRRQPPQKELTEAFLR
jgi:hypothetical protein